MPTINLTDPSNGTTADANVIANNNSALETLLNGGLDNTNVSPTANIAVSKIAPGSNGQILTTTGGVSVWGAVPIPSGVVVDYAGSAAPADWLLCDGSAVSRAVYSALFTAIGVLHGAGDGSTTFNLPDYRGRMGVGKGSHADVDTVGETDGSALADRRPKHKHTRTTSVALSDPGHAHRDNVDGDAGAGGITVAQKTGNNAEILASNPGETKVTGITVSAQPEFGPQTNSPTDGPAYIVINKIIKT